MKIINRDFGVSEARIGLSLLTVLSVALGYVALQHFGGTGETPPIEIRRDAPAERGHSASIAPVDDGQKLRVLEAQDAPNVPQMSQRPIWEQPAVPDAGGEFDLGSDSLWPGSPERTIEFGRLPSGPPR